MAHNTTNRRMLAPSSNPKPTIDSTHKNHHPEPNKHFSSLNTSHRGRTATRDQTHVGLDTHLQAKAMSVSAMAAVDPSDVKLQTQKKATQPAASKDKPSSRRASKHKVDTKGSINNGQEIVKLHYPTKEEEERERKEVNEEREDIKRLSSGAIVKIKELKVSDEEEHDLMKRPSLGIGRRRSFCGSHVELADFFSSTSARIVSVDMPPFMQIHAVGCARKACDSLEKFTSKALALSLKKEFDGVYGPAWHCIVGNSFGSFVTHSVGGFLYFSLDHKLYVLLFKTSVQKAD